MRTIGQFLWLILEENDLSALLPLKDALEEANDWRLRHVNRIIGKLIVGSSNLCNMAGMTPDELSSGKSVDGFTYMFPSDVSNRQARLLQKLKDGLVVLFWPEILDAREAVVNAAKTLCVDRGSNEEVSL